MPKIERIYRRTESGARAYQSPNSGLPKHHRSILGLIDADTHSDLVRASLRPYYGDKQICDWLDQLHTLGFIDAQAVSSSPNALTGGFRVEDLRRAAQKKAA